MEMLENHFLYIYIYIYKGKVHRVECPKGTRHTQKKKNLKTCLQPLTNTYAFRTNQFGWSESDPKINHYIFQYKGNYFLT